MRLQLQGSSVARGSGKPMNMFQTVAHIARHEGVTSLWKGAKPALLRQLTYGGMRYGLYEPIKQLLVGDAHDPDGPGPAGDFPIYIKLLAGCLSGALASGICNPTDVLKIRMQADTSGTLYRGLTHGFTTIVREEGLRGLYKGVNPTTQRAAIVAAVEIASYDEIKMRLIPLIGNGLGTHFSAAILAGFLATLASNPTDVVKARLMSQPVDEHGHGITYRGSIDCLRKTVRAEGVASLMKGFWPSFGRIGPHCVVTYVALERLRDWFGGGGGADADD